MPPFGIYAGFGTYWYNGVGLQSGPVGYETGWVAQPVTSAHNERHTSGVPIFIFCTTYSIWAGQPNNKIQSHQR